jgi:glucose/arabinose dehydrogenase
MNHHRHTFFTATVRRALCATMLAVGAATAIPAAHAQDPATANMPSASAPSTIDEAKLDKFVWAYTEVLQLQKEANDKQNTAKDPNAAQAVVTETESKMTSAVQKSGLEIAEFNQIAQQMLLDDDLRSRIAAKMQVRNSSGG